MTYIMVRNLAKELHRRFKAACAREGKSQNAKLLELIEQYVRRKERKK